TTRQAEMITGEGGFESGGALDHDSAFEHGSTTPSDPAAPFDGVVTALSRIGTNKKWEVRMQRPLRFANRSPRRLRGLASRAVAERRQGWRRESAMAPKGN